MKARLVISNPAKFYFMLLLVMVFVAGAASFITINVMTISGKYISSEKHEKLVSILDSKIDEYASIIEKNDADFNRKHEEIVKKLSMSEDTIAAKENLIQDMDTKIDYIAKKYYYVFEQTTKRATPNAITFSNLVTLDNECKKANIDPHLVVGLFNLESSFNTQASNSKSTALGLGQVLKGTGKSLYTKFLEEEGPYNHEEMATDGDTCIRMSVAYLKYLLNNNGNNVEQALISYNGGELGSKYYAMIDSYMIAKTSRGIKDGARYRE